MKLTKRGHYSVKALLDLSLQPEGSLASVKEIARRQNLPAPFLEKLLIELRRADLIISVRGPRGGYRLARAISDISLGEILTAVGETALLLSDYEATSQQAEDWVTHSIWKRLHEKTKTALYSISLEDLYYDTRSWQASQGEDASFVV